MYIYNFCQRIYLAEDGFSAILCVCVCVRACVRACVRVVEAGATAFTLVLGVGRRMLAMLSV